MRFRFIAMLIAGLLALSLAACGGDDDSSDGESGESAGETPAKTAEEPESDGDTSDGGAVAVAADPSGRLQFKQGSLSSGTGKVKFEFTNDSSVPHDFVIEEDGEKVAGTDVISKDKAAVDADLKAGAYTFFCSVANHRDEGMEGKLTAK